MSGFGSPLGSKQCPRTPPMFLSCPQSCFSNETMLEEESPTEENWEPQNHVRLDPLISYIIMAFPKYNN